MVFQLKPSSNHRPHHYNSDIDPHKKYQTDKSQIVHRIHLLILQIDAWVSGIWSAVVVQAFATCDMWTFCHHAQRPRGHLMIFDAPMLVQKCIDGSISDVWLSYVISCLEIALSSTTAITVTYNGDTTMTMTVSCNGDYNYTTVTTAAICNNSEYNKLWYLTYMPWHTPWQRFAIVVTILNHHICQRTWDVERS